jgi:hypothetical protein
MMPATRSAWWGVLLMATVIGVSTISWLLGSLLVRSTNTRVPPSPPAQELTIVTADGLALEAVYSDGRKWD